MSIKPLMMCEICWSNARNRFVLGNILSDKYIDLCEDCSHIFENIPNHIPDKQSIKYLKAKVNEIL
jgi:hypothetical protein